MKTKEYIIPEMEVVEMRFEAPLLDGSGDEENDGMTPTGQDHPTPGGGFFD